MGQIYASQSLYYEAVGSFTRITEAGLDDPFILKAKIGIAKAYQAWGRWADAQSVYEKLLNDKSEMPSEDKAAILFGYADALYQRGQFYAASSAYKKAIAEVPDYRFSEPSALFQWGEAAYRARVFDDAKLALLDFYNIYPKDPLAAVALMRVKTILNLQKKANPDIVIVSPKIASIDETLHQFAVKASRVSKKDPTFNLGRILLSIDALKKCKQNAPPSKNDAREPLPCSQPLVEEAFYTPSKLKRRANLEEQIKTDAIDYLTQIPPSTTAQGILLEAIYQLKRHNEIEKVVAVEATLLEKLPATSPYFREVESTLHKTILTELDTIRDPENIVTLFHSYPGAFTREMLQGEVGHMVAMSHVKTGLLSKAVFLLKPVSENFRYPLWKEALYEKGQAQLALANYGDAQKDLEFYQKISLQKEKAYADLGDLHYKRGDVTRTIVSYEKWLSHFPKHADRPDIYLKLSEAYRYRADYDNEIKVYSKWIAEGGDKIALPMMRLADTYFQLGEYKKAISSYRRILDEEYGGDKEMEWATFRLATSYELSGQEREGQKYFKNISQKTKDGLMRDFAQGKSSPF
jgi:tetratricopeptide (TPR) repeat protein